MENKKTDRRKVERFALEIPAKIRTSGSEKMELDIMTSNISSEGAFFQTSSTLEEGTSVNIELTLPLERLAKYLENRLEDSGSTLIKLSGKVLRTESEGMAISFNSDYIMSPFSKIAPHNN